MPLALQAKLLRVLQEGEFRPLGSGETKHVDVRIVAATNRDLAEEVQKGNFREDLYHRLAVIIVKVPGLNERAEDIPLLVNHFNNQICLDYKTPAKTFTSSAIEALKAHNWTGNIRELRNVVERLVIMCGESISLDDVKLYAGLGI